MKQYIQITRHLYEEPYHLNLVVLACNGVAAGGLELYTTATCLREIGDALSVFPTYQRANFLFERGSERPEDRFSWYFRLRARAIDSMEKCVIQLRFNNNQLPHHPKSFEEPQLTDFYIKTTDNRIKILGNLFLKFADLEHQRLFWSDTEGFVDDELKFRDKQRDDTIRVDTIRAALASLPADLTKS